MIEVTALISPAYNTVFTFSAPFMLINSCVLTCCIWLSTGESWWANSAQVWTGSTNNYGVFRAWVLCVLCSDLVNRKWLCLFFLCRSGHWVVELWAHLQVLASLRLHGELPLTLPVLVASFITCALEHQNSKLFKYTNSKLFKIIII